MNFDRIRELVWEQTFQSSKLSSVLVMLEEVGKFISGRTPKSDELASIGDIPYFKVGDMNTEGNEKVLRITSLFLKEKAGKTFPAGAIVYPKNGGAVFTNKRRILATESVIDLNTGGFVCGERLNQAYTYMFFCGLDFRKISKGTALPTIDQKKLHQTKIPVPSLEEQSRIVTRLGEAFAEIDRAEKAYEELQTLAGVLRGQILQEAIQGKLVPQLAEEGVVEQIGGAPEEVPFEIPESWKWCHMKGITQKIHYGFTASAANAGNAKLLRITDIQDGRVNWDTVPFCDVPEKKLASCKLGESDVVIARTGGTIGKSFLLTDVSDVAVFASYLIRLIPCAEVVNPKYLMVFLNSPEYWKQLKAMSQGTGQPNVNAKSLSTLLLPLPPLDEQARIVAKVEELLKHVDALSAK